MQFAKFGVDSSNYRTDKYELCLETFLAHFSFNMSQVQRDIFLSSELLGNIYCIYDCTDLPEPNPDLFPSDKNDGPPGKAFPPLKANKCLQGEGESLVLEELY